MHKVTLYSRKDSITGTALIIWKCLQRRSELNELICWAKRKRVPHVRQHYFSYLCDEEKRLLRYCVSQPRLTVTLRYLFWIYRHLMDRPRYYVKGAAQKYRFTYLTSRI